LFVFKPVVTKCASLGHSGNRVIMIETEQPAILDMVYLHNFM